jgi:hypothetical protein
MIASSKVERSLDTATIPQGRLGAVGHSSIAITMDIYSHLMPNMQGEAAAAVDGSLRAAINKRAEDVG